MSAPDLAEAAQQLAREGLVVGTAGNVSVRTRAGLVITPSAVPYEQLTSAHLAALDAVGVQVGGTHRKSSEWRLHLALYQARGGVQAVVHTHSAAATALAVLRRPIPPIHYAMHQLGGEVPVAPYATFGTAELAEGVVAALGAGHAALMANHGAVVVGESLAAALERARLLEWVCRVYLHALSGGTPHVLSPSEMAAAAERLQSYRPAPP